MLRWFTENTVASNLLIVAICLGGILSLPMLDREVMPGVPLDMIEVEIMYPGGNPAEIEERISIRLEEAIHDIVGIEAIHSEAVEGRGGVSVEISKGFELQTILNEIKARVDAIDNLPAETEEPQIREVPWSEEFIELVVSGDTDEATLKKFGEKVRDDIARLPGVDEVELEGIRKPEMAIEVSEVALRKHALTFDDIVHAIRQSSINLPGGAIRASGGDIALRTVEQAYGARDFAAIVLVQRKDGTRVTLGDVADIRDGFEETDTRSRFNGRPAATISVKVRNNPDVVAVNDAIRKYTAGMSGQLPPGMHLDIWLDRSEIFRSRAKMLITSGLIGLAMVFALLTLFLRPAIATWVCIGIAVSFLGALWVIPSTPISMNMMTLFAFILVLGIVVDDAIIIGESIHAQVERGMQGTEASFEGARRVAKPVIFAAVTTMVAFSPPLFIEGASAKLTMPLSIVVIAALTFSLIDAFFILPAHLSSLKPIGGDEPGRLARLRRRVANSLSRFSTEKYRPFVESAIRNRYLTLAVFVAIWIVMLSVVQGGWIKQQFYPLIPGDNAVASITLSDGIAFSRTEEVVQQVEIAADGVRRHYLDNNGTDIVKNIHTLAKENNITVTMELVPGEERGIPIQEVVDIWRTLIGFVPDTKSYAIDYTISRREADVKLGLTGDDSAALAAATEIVEKELATYDGLFNVNNSQRSARFEIQVNAKATAEHYNIEPAEIAKQVRQGFFGEEAQRIPRGRDDVKVMVRYPAESRKSLEQINRMRIRTDDGMEVPIAAVAELQFVPGTTAIRRLDRRRIVEITADADYNVADPARIVAELRRELSPRLQTEFPGVEFLIKGQQEAAGEFLGEMVRLTLMAFLFTFGLIAIAFRSYVQPAIVMSAIPFGLLGSIVGHLLFDVTMSMFSFMGVVAAAGVVVNDNLVLIDRINDVRKTESNVIKAVVQSATSRFRPILLTSVTTFVGLLPIMSERSSQSEYLKPMTLSLGFGVFFASFVTLIMVPSLYVVVEDVRAWFQARRRRDSRRVRTTS